MKTDSVPPRLLLSFSSHAGKLVESWICTQFLFCVIYTQFFCAPANAPRAFHAARFVSSFVFNFLLPLVSVTGDFPPSADASAGEQPKKLFRREFCVTMSSRANPVINAAERCREKKKKKETNSQTNRKQLSARAVSRDSPRKRKKRSEQPSDSLWRRRRPISKSRPAELAANARPTWAPLLMKSASR